MVNMANAELALAKSLSHNARKYIVSSAHNEDVLKDGVSVLDYGPGTLLAFSEKTLPLVRILKGTKARCVLVDSCRDFLAKIKSSEISLGIKIETVEADIFSGKRHILTNEPAFIVMFGRTFGNIVSPISSSPPEFVIVDLLERIANGANTCWMGISIGSDLSAERAKRYYEAHPEFQLNIFYRMQAELPIDGRFDPGEFRYEALVFGNNDFIQVAHTAVIRRDACFILGGVQIALRCGDRFHLKNSFSFSKKYMAECATKAGLMSLDVISDSAGSDLHIFAKHSRGNSKTLGEMAAYAWKGRNSEEPSLRT